SNLKLFNIRFTVINYLAGKRSQFAYKLEGFDKDWIHISQYVSLRGATYSNLDPGRYVFKVKACNNSGQWCETPTEFFVDIVPMWYQTWWFKLLITIGVAGMVFWAVYFFLLRTRMRMQMQVEQMERQKIEELSQEKVRFYTNISHELRTPLTLILAPLEEIAGKSRFLDKHIQEKLAYVYRNTQKLLLIVNQSLDLHKADSGTLPVQVAYRNVDEIAWNIFSAFQEKADRHGIKYHFQSNLNESLLPVDQMYLETILMNLLSNAFKFTPDNRVIELILEKEPEAWSICVRDQGIGISAEKQKRIFERFYQAGQDHPGSGIGLSLVRCLVDKHHGVVSVKSSECVGTAFKVVFPDNIDAFSKDEKAIEEAAAPVGDKISEPLFADPLPDSFVQQVSPATDPETPAETILVVDDNVEMTAYLKANFRSRYVTLTAGNGEEAMQILKLHKVDVIVSDVMMPVMDGIRLCELVKRNFQTCHIPVILLSAKGSVDAQNKGVHVGADDYIAKPFSISLLNGKIRNILKAKERLIHHYCNTINIDTAKMTSNVLDEEFIRKAMKIINENLDNENFTADELAQKLYISRSTLYLKMNSISGESPAGFIRRIRLNTACRLLLEGRYGISEISTMVGFNSPAYFSSSFKKNIGCLPSEYVKKQQEPSCITE
ncbi:MAG: hybrid sensor histidine kinase/response regulator transcription factor, partial [Bacteroidales bacterium]